MGIDGILALIGLSSLWLLWQRVKSLVLNADTAKTQTQLVQIDQKIVDNNQKLVELTKNVQADIQAYEDAKKNTPGSSDTH